MPQLATLDVSRSGAGLNEATDDTERQKTKQNEILKLCETNRNNNISSGEIEFETRILKFDNAKSLTKLLEIGM